MEEKHVPTNGMEENENDNTMNINADDNVSGQTHLNEPVAEESELEKTRAGLEEMRDKYLRLAAEFDNFKRRTSKERIELLQTAGKDVISSLLEVLDDCDRAQSQLEKSEDAALREGVMLVFNKLRGSLQGRGLKAMEVRGQDFNPDLHEAVTEIPAPGEALKGKVVDELVKGYYLNDKIIRFAKVVVGK